MEITAKHLRLMSVLDQGELTFTDITVMGLGKEASQLRENGLVYQNPGNGKGPVYGLTKEGSWKLSYTKNYLARLTQS